MPKTFTLTTTLREALDQRWFDHLQQLDTDNGVIGLSTELFTTLGPPHAWLEQQRKRFEADGTTPSLLPQGIDLAQIDEHMRRLQALCREISKTERRLPIRRAYIQKLNEASLHNTLLTAAANGDSRMVATVNRQLYGMPDRKLFAAVCAWLRVQAEQETASPNPHIAQTATRLLAAIPDIGGKPRHIIPRAWVFKRVRDLHFADNGYFQQLIGSHALPDSVDAASGDPIVQRAIRTVGSDYTVADSTDELWGVIHSRRQVVRPPDYRLPRNEFIGIVAHEIGSHLLERCNGRQQPLRLLEIGLDRYEAGNEGRAFLREQIVHHSPYDMLRQASWEYIILLHLAVSLGAGLHRRPYGFAELYQTIYPVCHFFQSVRQPDNPVYAEVNARNETWNLLVRVLKGTDGQGGAYYKDLVYLEGNIRAWRLARFNPSLTLFGDNGKFDIARLEHRWILRSLGITTPRLRPLH